MAVYKSIPVERLRELFDYDEDSGLVTWRVKVKHAGAPIGATAGSKSKAVGYIYVGVARELFLLHRVIWAMKTGTWPATEIDHIDLDRTNNRWSNLRLATRPQNSANGSLRSTNKSGLKGACWDRRRNCWRATITINWKHTHLGRFDTPEEAHAAYCEAARKYHGDFARTE
jgi:hypothetical protein